VGSSRHGSPKASRSRTRRPGTRAGADAVCDGLTVTFEVRYADGAEGDRVATTQADAIAALLGWIADRDQRDPVAGNVDIDDTENEDDRAA
jgi:hypothetical protein